MNEKGAKNFLCGKITASLKTFYVRQKLWMNSSWKKTKLGLLIDRCPNFTTFRLSKRIKYLNHLLELANYILNCYVAVLSYVSWLWGSYSYFQYKNLVWTFKREKYDLAESIKLGEILAGLGSPSSFSVQMFYGTLLHVKLIFQIFYMFYRYMTKLKPNWKHFSKIW